MSLSGNLQCSLGASMNSWPHWKRPHSSEFQNLSVEDRERVSEIIKVLEWERGRLWPKVPRRRQWSHLPCSPILLLLTPRRRGHADAAGMLTKFSLSQIFPAGLELGRDRVLTCLTGSTHAFCNAYETGEKECASLDSMLDVIT